MAEKTEGEFEEVIEGEQQTDETVTGDEGEQVAEATTTDDEATVYTFADAAPATDEEVQDEQESSVIKALREAQRKEAREKAELAKQLREREEQLAALQGAAMKPAELGPKPTRADPDIDYDDEKYAAAIDAWTRKSIEAEAAAKARKTEEQQAQEAFQQKQERYKQAKQKVAADDFDIAEAAVMTALSKDKKFAILLDLADAPQRLVYALGKSPEKLEELSKLSVPLFIKKLGALETQMKPQSTTRKPPPPAERQTYGGKGVGIPQSKRLESLKAAAEKSGDYSAYHAARREQKAA